MPAVTRAAAKIMSLTAADIRVFTAAGARAKNDANNKLRERILASVLNPPAEFIADPEHGPQWTMLRDKFGGFLKDRCPNPYAKIVISIKAGRCHHYDADVLYLDSTDKPVSVEKLEFKYGASSINSIPQFLSLQAADRSVIPGATYDAFYYDTWLDQYIATDAGITETKPTRSQYLNLVKKVDYDCHPFLAQLKAREGTNKAAKNKIVNASIKAYLEANIKSIDIPALTAKFRATQEGKHYALWSKNSFHHDKISDAEMSDLVLDPIVRRGNTVVLRAGNLCEYKLLLRWRNHKGILNPAWQISMKRL